MYRQIKKSGSKEERAPSAKSRASKLQSSKSDSGYSGTGLEVSIATASAIDCVIEEEKPPKGSPKPSSRNDQGRSSVDSTSSSSGSSEKGRIEIQVKKSEDKNVLDLKQREALKKQIAERKKSASEKSEKRTAAKKKGVDEDGSARRSAENGERIVVTEEKRPTPSAGKPKSSRTEV